MNNVPWLSVLWLVPLAGAVLIILLPPGRRRLAKWAGMVVSVLTLAVSIVVAAEFKPSAEPYQFVEKHSWIPAFGAGYTLGVDGIAVVLVLLTTVLIPLLLVAGWNDATDADDLSPASGRYPQRPAPPRLRSSRAAWRREPVAGIPAATNTVVVSADDTGDEFFLDSSGFDTPSRLMRGTDDGALEQLKSAPAFFDAENVSVTQNFVNSKDGTPIPYFVVRPAGPASDGPAPTLLYGYGGFESSNTPGYSGVLGRLWLARGGTYVLANIRGGGEYGPAWHTQAIREGRHKVAEDFAAVATDLVDRGITRVEQLGAQGGSNGGLLMGIMLTQYPEKFGALVCSVPLLDMKRYHLLLAGASWVAEYGDPDNPDDWEFIAEYSPYQNISATRRYPPVLMTTSTRDDRVHPGHARKMTAALEAAGHPVFYYENIEGGHAGAADNEQVAFKSALTYSFLWQMLGGRTQS